MIFVINYGVMLTMNTRVKLSLLYMCTLQLVSHFSDYVSEKKKQNV